MVVEQNRETEGKVEEEKQRGVQRRERDGFRQKGIDERKKEKKGLQRGKMA